MKTTFIYALCEPGTRTVRYIGKANDPKKRLRGHLKYNSILTETYLGRWLRKVVSNGLTPALIILAEVSRDSWQEEEIRYIRAARVLGLNLTNGTDGGDGVTMTSETRAKISATVLGMTRTPETRAKMSVSKMGNQHFLGHKHTEAAKAKMSAATSGENNPMFGRPWTPARRAAQNKKGASV